MNRTYLLALLIVIMALSVPSTLTSAQSNPTYTITPHSKTYKGAFTTYTTLNNHTKHYYVLRSYLEHLEKKGGGTLVLNKGTYTITNTLYVPSNVTIKLKNGATLKKGTETGLKVGSNAGKKNMKPSKSIFQFIRPSKSGETGVYGGYDGEKNISLIGEGTATIDMDFDQDALTIAAGHNKNILIENITFKNMHSGHFIEIDATQDAIIRKNTFINSKPSKNLNKEAINIDTPDRATLGWNQKWSTFDKTPNSMMLIENNYFYDLDRAIGTHKYSGDRYHDQIIIKNNKIEKMRSDAIRAMNWSHSTIKDNLIIDVAPSSGNNNRGILASGVIHPTFTNNTFANMPRAMQFFPWQNSGAGSEYAVTYNELSAQNIKDLKNNTIVNANEDFIRINHVYNAFDKANSDWIDIKTERFYDVSAHESGYEEAVDLAERDIFTGYSDHSFKPFNYISRQHIAALLYRSLDLENPHSISSTLTDIRDVNEDHEYAREIATVINGNVFVGSKGKFNPANNITRGQMASVLVRAFDLQDTGESVELVDLNTIDPSHRENVKILAQHKITVGKINHNGDHYFDADGYLNRIQFAIFLHRVLE